MPVLARYPSLQVRVILFPYVKPDEEEIVAAFSSSSVVHEMGMQYSSNPDISPWELQVDVNDVMYVVELVPPLASM